GKLPHCSDDGVGPTLERRFSPPDGAVVGLDPDEHPARRELERLYSGDLHALRSLPRATARTNSVAVRETCPASNSGPAAVRAPLTPRPTAPPRTNASALSKPTPPTGTSSASGYGPSSAFR